MMSSMRIVAMGVLVFFIGSAQAASPTLSPSLENWLKIAQSNLDVNQFSSKAAVKDRDATCKPSTIAPARVSLCLQLYSDIVASRRDEAKFLQGAVDEVIKTGEYTDTAIKMTADYNDLLPDNNEFENFVHLRFPPHKRSASATN